MALSPDEISRLRHITRFYGSLKRFSETEEPCGRLEGGRDPETGVSYLPAAVYPKVFHNFRDQLVEDGWLEGSYSQEEGFRYMDDMDLLEEADLPTLERLLLFCDRGEYWCTGFWKGAVESGFVPRTLRRLLAIERQAEGGSKGTSQYSVPGIVCDTPLRPVLRC